MDENTKSLYDLYIGAGHTETPEQFLDAKNQMGDEVFNTYINSQIELKKKDQTEIIPIENFSTPSIQETNQMISDNNLNQRFPELKQKEATIIPQNLLEANSTESDSTLVPNSTESDSISPEKYLPKEDGFFDLLGKYKNYNPKTGIFSGKKRIIPDEEIDRATKFYDDQKAKNEQIRKQNSLNFLAGKPKDDDVVYIDFSVDAINQQQKLADIEVPGENDPKPYLRTDIPFQKKGVEYNYYAEDPDAVRENNDRLLKAEKAGWLILTTDLRTGEIVKDKFGNYYHTYISDEAIDAQNKHIQSLIDAATKENKSRASYNFGNLFSAPTPETETQQYLNELDKEYGITLLTTEQREQLSTAEGRKNIEIELETQKRLKENKNLNYNTVFAQVSKEKKGADIQQQITNGSNYVKRMFFGGGIATNARNSSVFGEANDGYYSDDERDEYNFYVNYFNNPDNVAAFGAFMDDDGKALFDSSWIKRTNVSQNQEKRKEMFATFLSWKGKQDRLDLKFSQDALETNASKAESYRAANDLNNYRNEVSKVNFYQQKIQEASAKVQKNVNELSNSSQFYSKSNTKAKEKADFQARVQNDEFSANAQNFIGNVFLGATTSVQNAVTGLLRISAVPFGKGNVNDFIDTVSEPISVGNVDIARISDEIISLKGNGKEYKKINGYLYEVGENGKIFRPTSKIDENSLNEIDRTRNINSSGLAFVTSKMLADIYLTKSIGAGINSRLSFAANALSNSKKITAIFGEGSQIANQATTFARTMQSPTANMITGWTVQSYNDNYLAAKKGGIENETNRHLYAFTTSFLLSQLQRINPDTNFLKTINTEYKAIVSNLMENNTQKAILGIQSFTKKAWENTSKELVEENLQQGTQDLINIIVNATGEKNLQVSTLDDYKDVFIGTVVPSLVLSVMGGRVRQAEIGGRKVDLTQLTRNELVTELARSTQGVKLLKEFRDNAYFESQQNEAEKLVSEIQERQKYINKIPDSENYSTETINSVIPLLQEIDRKQQSKKNDDGTFTARIDAEISNLTTQVNEILDQDAETTQPTPKPETVQEQNPITENQPEQGTPSTEQNTESSVENPEIIQQKIKNKNLFKDGGLFANILGGSGVDSVLSGHQERNGIEFIQWSNPNTGDVDVIMTGTGSHDFVGYYRIYENGKPTNKWSSKFENQSRNKDNFKLMISGVQELLPSNHQYTEKTSISTDGLRVWEQQLRNGYELQTDADGNIITNEVMINGDSIENDLGIDVEKGAFNPVNVNTNEQFETAKKALLPKLKIFGLDENNIRWDQNNNTIKIDLPVLKRSASQNETAETENNNPKSQPATAEGQQNIPAELEVLNIENNENQETIPNIAQPNIAEASVESGNTTTTTVENSKTAEGENTQVPKLPKIQINQEIFSDDVDASNLSEEQVAEYDNQIKDAVSMFESLNTPSVENENTVEKNSVNETTNVQQNPVTQNSRISTNGKYNVVESTDSDGRKTFELLDINNKPVKVSSKTKDVYVAEYINAQEYPETEIDFEDGMNENDVNQEIISKSNNPKEIAQVIATTPRFDSDAVTGSKDWAIAQVIGKNGVSRDSFTENDDANNITNAIARTYFGKNKSGKSLDTIAQQASEQLTGDYSGDSVTVQDIVDFIKKYPNDPSKAERPNNPIYDAAVEKFIQLTGQNPTKNLLDKLNPKQESTELNLVTAEAEYDLLSAEAQNNLQNEYDQWFNSLPLDQKTQELQKTFYENENDSTGNPEQESSENVNQPQPNRQGEGNQNAGNEETAGRTEPTERIEDFGEKIGGAKKDLRQKLDTITSKDIESNPLSKTLPKPDFQKIAEDGLVSPEEAIFLKYLYESIPSKPRVQWKLNSWVRKVESFLDIYKNLLDGGSVSVNIEGVKRTIPSYSIYEAIHKELGIDTNLNGFDIKEFVGGRISVVRGSTIIKDYANLPDAIADLKNIIAKAESISKQKSIKFSVYQDTRSKKYFIGKKGANEVVNLVSFESSKDAIAFLKDNQQQLEDMWNGMKTVQNERRDSNRKRIGKDHRAGKNINPEEFQNTFGFRGVEFGNYVNNAERQAALNDSYDALMDLAYALGIEPKALTLNGELGLAFGARGSGGKNAASAHYERGKIVINLTKNKGAGSLAHEWWHALDNYFSRTRGYKDQMLTEKPIQLTDRTTGKPQAEVRKEIIESFKNIVSTINKSDLNKRSKEADKVRSKPYFGTAVEMSARAFENYVASKLDESGIINDYLVNFKDQEEWMKGGDISKDTYPYPTKDESIELNKTFQELFDTVEQKTDDNGNVILYQQSQKNFAPLTKEAFQKLIEKLKKPFAKAFKNLNVTTDWNAFKEKAKALGLNINFNSQFQIDPNARKQKQLALINKTNPAPNDYNTWVRSEGDILTAEEAFAEAFEDGEMYPDFTVEDMQEALDSGEVTIYSSRPIEEGSFITPSKMNAEEYAGGPRSKVYSKKVKITDIAWIDQGEGQFAPVQEPSINFNIRTDRQGNPIGDGGWNIEPSIINLSNYPQIDYDIDYSKTTESTYVKYYNKDNGESVTVRFSNHNSNAVKFGDQLDGYSAGPNEILHRLGLKKRIFNPEKSKNIGAYQVKKVIANRYEESDKTIQEIYALPLGSDLSEYKGKRAKGSNWIIGGDTVKEVSVMTKNAFGQSVEKGTYSYEDIQFMHTTSGEVYGAKLPDGTIYFNPSKLNANTAIHEFSHLWEHVMPNAWKKGLELFKETATGKKLFNQLKSEGNYSTISDDLIWSEALNTHIGNIGEQQYQNPKGKMKEFVDWYKTTMAKFLNAVGIKNNWTKETNLSAFTDTVLGDLMGERELDVEGNNQNNSADFQIIGEQGARNLDSLEESTHRLDNLSIAREMETSGKSPLETRLATGWEKGVDGKWRYEIKDLSIISDDATVSGYNNLQEWFDGNKRTDGKLSLINFAGITSRQTRREAINNAKNRGFDITNIFDAYPKISEINIELSDVEDSKGSYNPRTNTITLNKKLSFKEADSTLIHEIQHAVQEIEGFASGGNYKSTTNLSNKTPFRKYQRLAGETEARNVQTRANMSMAERRATLLSETEDVAREDQIILMDGLGVSESNSGSSINKKAMPKSTFAAVANATSQNGREAGYKELVNSNWFKSLQQEVQAGITSDNFQNTMIEQAGIIQSNDKIARQNSVQNAKNKKDEVIKDIKKEFKDKILDLKKEYRAVKTKLDKITNAKERLSEKIYWRKQAVNGIKLLLNDKFIRDKVTHSELRQLLDAAEKITKARNINSAFDNFNDKLDKIIDKTEGRANKKDEWEEFKKNPEALQADPTATYNPVTGRNAIVKFKEKWFANQGGLLKPFMNMKDNARGKINWELRIAKNTVQKLLSLQNKLKYNSPDNNKTIDEALKGNNKSFDKLPDDIKPLIAQMRNQIDGLQAYLVDNNLVTPDQALNINENLGSYVTRGYDYFDGKTGTLRTAERISKKLYRFLFRKQGLLKSEFDTAKWADAVTVFQQNVLNDIAADKKFGNKSKYGEDFHNQSDLAIQSYARTKGEGDLMEYIKSLESDYQKQGSQQKADTSVLERRKDVPEPIRKLLGEYEDPKISFALTISRMSQLAYQRKFMAQLKDQGMGSLFFRENDPNRPATHFVKIASDSNDAFAPLNGLYTTPEFKDVFLDVTEQNINDIGRLWMKATGLVKVGKTVLSPVTQMVNFFANPGFLINNGTILDIKNLGASVKVFIDDMKGSKGTDPILQELIEENIIDQSIVFNEIESDFGANIERDLMRNVRQNIAVKTARDFLSIPFRAYKASDDFFKAFTYYAEANRYSKSIFGKKYKELTGEDRIKIRKIASEVTKNTMPNYDRRYKAADYARMKTGNLLGNFLSFQAESIRTKINSIQIAVADIKNPETRSVGIQRMAGIMTYNAIYAGITSYLGKTAGLGLVGLLGFFDDDDEDEANKKFNLTIPDWARSTEKFARKEKDGTITFYTYGNSNPYGIWYKSMNAYQNGSSNNSSGGILSVIDEVATPFFGTEMSADWAVNTFIKEENDWGADLITWEDKARYSWEKLSPTAFKVYKDNMDENDKNNFDIYNALGIKKYNYNPTEQLGFKFRDWQTKINDLGKKKYNLEMQFANGKIKEEDAVARYEEYNNEQIEITDEFKKVYEAFIFIGADVIELNEKANSAYINKYNSSRDFLNYLNKNSKETEKLDLKEKGKEIFSK